MSSHLVTVRQIMTRYGLSKYAVYHSIKNDPTFPVINIGPRKNYRINRIQFEEWLYRRTNAADMMPFTIPSGEELLRSVGK